MLGRERDTECVVPAQRRNPRSIDVVVERTERYILRLRHAPDDPPWALPSRGIRQQSPGMHSTWDVFDAGFRPLEVICYRMKK